jgi:hypothetical protein
LVRIKAYGKLHRKRLRFPGTCPKKHWGRGASSKCVEKFKSSYRNSKNRIKTLEIIVVFLFKIDVHHLKRGVNYAILIAKGGERIEEL